MRLQSHFLLFQRIRIISRTRNVEMRVHRLVRSEYTTALRFADGRARLPFSFSEEKNEYLCVFVCTPRNAINFTQWCYVLTLFMVSTACVRKMLRRKTLGWSNTRREILRRHISKFIFTCRDKWLMLTYSKIGRRALQNYCIFLK